MAIAEAVEVPKAKGGRSDGLGTFARLKILCCKYLFSQGITVVFAEKAYALRALRSLRRVRPALEPSFAFLLLLSGSGLRKFR